MKLKPLAFLLILVSSGFVSNAQTSGGPDNFGYHWANNQDPIGSAPIYSWKNISTSGTAVTGLGDDNAAGPFNLGFYFNYYGIWYNTLWIGSNGWVSFQNIGSVSAPFTSIPSSNAPNNVIAGMLADLTFTDANYTPVTGAFGYFYTNLTDSIIVEYDSIPFWDDYGVGYCGRNSFEIILTAPDYSIQFQYKQLINNAPCYNLLVKGLKIGIEDSTGTDGLQVVSDSLPSDSSAVKFFFPGTFSTNDLTDPIFAVKNYPNPCNDHTDISYTLVKNEG